MVVCMNWLACFEPVFLLLKERGRKRVISGGRRGKRIGREGGREGWREEGEGGRGRRGRLH